MANLRRLKKDIDYVLEELVFDCDMAFYVNGQTIDWHGYILTRD